MIAITKANQSRAKPVNMAISGEMNHAQGHPIIKLM
jgi:hypothetical protein